MIAGCVVLEDRTIVFNEKDTGKIEYAISDSLIGKMETKIVDAEKFMIALGLGMRFSGEPLDIDEFEIAEEVQPDDPELRFIP